VGSVERWGFALSGGDALWGFLHWLSSITTFPIFSLFSLCRPQAGRAVSFLCSKKKPKKAFSAEFLPNFVACATRGADSAGKRLTREEVYIETIETAGEGGGGFVCVMDTRRPVAFRCINVGANCVRPLPRCHSEHSEESYLPYTSLKFRPDGRRRSAMPSFRLSPIWYAVTEIVPTSYGRVRGSSGGSFACVMQWRRPVAFCDRNARCVQGGRTQFAPTVLRKEGTALHFHRKNTQCAGETAKRAKLARACTAVSGVSMYTSTFVSRFPVGA